MSTAVQDSRCGFVYIRFVYCYVSTASLLGLRKSDDSGLSKRIPELYGRRAERSNKYDVRIWKSGIMIMTSFYDIRIWTNKYDG